MLTGLLAVPALAEGPIEILEHALDSDITPHSVAFSPVGSEAEGTLWFTDNAGGSLFEFNPGMPEVEPTEIFLGDAVGPRGVAAGADAIWVAGFNNDTLYKVTPSKDEPVVEVLELGTLPGLQGRLQPSNIALSGDGETAWVTLTGDDRLLGFSTEGEFTAESLVKDYPTSTDTLPTQIVEGADGRLWYSTQSHTRHGVGALDPETGVVSDYPMPSVGAMVGIAAADDYIYVTSFNDGLVYGVAMDGTIQRPPVALREGSRPRAIAIGEDNSGAASTAWVVEEGTPGVVQGAIAQIDLREGVLVAETDLPTSDALPTSIAADPTSSKFWGTARAASSLFSFSAAMPSASVEVVTVQGAGQASERGAEFESPLVARVQFGPVGEPNVPVRFTVVGTSGSGFAPSPDPNVRVSRDGTSVTVISVNDPSAPARHGTAEAPRLIAGPLPGKFAVRADVAGVDTSAVFDLEVVPGAATGLWIDSGDGQSAAPYTPFDRNLRVVATNSTGAPIQGLPVTFAIQGPTGSTFADGTVTSTGYTDFDGLAGSARVYAGDSGPLTVVARVEGGPSVTFDLTVTGNTHLHKNPVTGEPW